VNLQQDHSWREISGKEDKLGKEESKRKTSLGKQHPGGHREKVAKLYPGRLSSGTRHLKE
jgi:hypothetical protein